MSSSFDGMGPQPPRPSVVEELSALVREVLTFGTTVGTSVAQLDTHKDTLEVIKTILTRIETEEKRKNNIKEAEERRLEARGGRDHEFRMRILHGVGGLLTGSIVPALLYFLLGYNPNDTGKPNCPPPEVEHEQAP